jgi:hypothetical protein
MLESRPCQWISAVSSGKAWPTSLRCPRSLQSSVPCLVWIKPYTATERVNSKDRWHKFRPGRAAVIRPQVCYIARHREDRKVGPISQPNNQPRKLRWPHMEQIRTHLNENAVVRLPSGGEARQKIDHQDRSLDQRVHAGAWNCG